jgi:hypothetical protein
MRIKIEPGKDPAAKAQIRLTAGGEDIENARILEAYNDHGTKRVVAEITWSEADESNEQTERDVHTEVQRESGSSRNRKSSLLS